MTIPSVMLIEMAADSLQVRNDFRNRQLNELHAFGDVRAQSLGATGITKDFQTGYQLGLETARMYLRGNPAAVQAGVEL